MRPVGNIKVPSAPLYLRNLNQYSARLLARVWLLLLRAADANAAIVLFFDCGSTPSGLATLVRDELSFSSSPIVTSQLVGLPKSKPQREPSQPLMSTANFGAEYSHPAKSKDTLLKQEKIAPRHVAHEHKAESKQLKTRTKNRFAEFPHTNFNRFCNGSASCLPLTQSEHSLW